MDALKKAEEEKKQAAKRLQEVEMDARETSGENIIADSEQAIKEDEEEKVNEPYLDTSQFSLEPLSLAENFEETKEAKIDDQESEQKEIPTVDATEAFSEDLTLENTVSDDANAQLVFEETQKEIDLNDTTIIEGLSVENASAPFDDTFHGVVFEEEQETDVYEETLPGVPADQLAKDLGGGKYQPTPVAAQTVFSAGRPSKNKSSFKWGVFVVLILLAIGSFSIFYYFTITPVSRELPSPMIARGIESSGIEAITIPEPIINPQTSEAGIESVTDTSMNNQIEEVQTELNETQPVEAAVTSAQEVITKSEEVVTDSTQAVELISLEETPEIQMGTTSLVEDTVEPVTEVPKDSIEVEEVTTDISASLATTENVPVDTSLISISKGKQEQQENVMISQAFKAYQDGHYDAAKSLYSDVLKSDPDNRDAHLGLGAIAISQLDRKSAYSHYVHLIELNPLDTLAMSSLIGLSNSADPIKDESAIKMLMQRDDDVPYLYFLLGNLYAKQKRWANAQQAFFDAYRLDTTNADYVLNLAISLDQLGQYDTALDYYQTAINLSQNTSSRFDLVSVNQRILVLSKLIDSKS
jgi:tetratricopeptide (TPR) repeat protein